VPSSEIIPCQYRPTTTDIIPHPCIEMFSLDRIETWPNGARYEGEYQNDLMHGKGTFWYSDGRRFSGEFKEGRCEDDPDNGDFGAFINS
jgi:hypothetical protein